MQKFGAYVTLNRPYAFCKQIPPLWDSTAAATPPPTPVVHWKPDFIFDKYSFLPD